MQIRESWVMYFLVHSGTAQLNANISVNNIRKIYFQATPLHSEQRIAIVFS